MVTPLPNPTTRMLCGSGCIIIEKCASIICVYMSMEVDASGFPLIMRTFFFASVPSWFTSSRTVIVASFPSR